MLYSIIDIGSNTVKISVLDDTRLFSSAPTYFKAVPLNLRSKVENNCLREDALEALCALLQDFLRISENYTSLPPIVFATASLRGLKNTDAALDTIKKRTGIDVDLISGETEAYYSFLGAKGSTRAKEGITVDLGGGSTEILTFRNNRVCQAVSLPFGCLTLYHLFFENGTNRYEDCCAYVRKHLKTSAPASLGKLLLLSGGSAKAMLKYKNIMEDKKSITVGIRQMKRILRHYNNPGSEKRDKIEQVLRDRFRLIPPALSVFHEITLHYQRDQAVISRSGVREGCLFSLLQAQKK